MLTVWLAPQSDTGTGWRPGSPAPASTSGCPPDCRPIRTHGWRPGPSGCSPRRPAGPWPATGPGWPTGPSSRGRRWWTRGRRSRPGRSWPRGRRSAGSSSSCPPTALPMSAWSPSPAASWWTAPDPSTSPAVICGGCWPTPSVPANRHLPELGPVRTGNGEIDDPGRFHQVGRKGLLGQLEMGRPDVGARRVVLERLDEDVFVAVVHTPRPLEPQIPGLGPGRLGELAGDFRPTVGVLGFYQELGGDEDHGGPLALESY